MEKVIKFLGVLAIVVLVVGCGGNLFKGLEQESESKKEKIYEAKIALDRGDYQTAMGKLKDELPKTNSECALPENKEVCIIYVQAQLGAAGFDAPTILSNAIKNIERAFTAEQNFKIVRDLLPDIDLNTLDDATAKLNFAQPTISGEQLTAGVANVLSAVLTVYNKFDTNRDGKLTDADAPLQDAGAAATAWQEIESKVINNAIHAATFIEQALTGESETTQDLKDAINDAKTQLDELKQLTQGGLTETEKQQLLNNIIGLD